MNHEQKVSDVTVREEKERKGEKSNRKGGRMWRKERKGWMERVKGREEGGGKEEGVGRKKLEEMRMGEVNDRDGGRREG